MGLSRVWLRVCTRGSCLALLAAATTATMAADGRRDAELAAALVSPAAEQREWALDRLIETPDPDPAIQQRIAAMLDDRDLYVAGKAATALSRLDARSLRHPRPDARTRHRAAALGRHAGPVPDHRRDRPLPAAVDAATGVGRRAARLCQPGRARAIALARRDCTAGIAEDCWRMKSARSAGRRSRRWPRWGRRRTIACPDLTPCCWTTRSSMSAWPRQRPCDGSCRRYRSRTNDSPRIWRGCRNTCPR